MSGEMPEDVMREAKRASYATEATGDDTAAITSEIGVTAIARALLAERERCARIAESNAHAECAVAEQIAAAIRNPVPTEGTET